MSDHDYAGVAIALRNAADMATPIAPVAPSLPSGSVDVAYRVQEMLVQSYLDHGHRIVGYKVGLTNTVIQEQLGVDQPDFGVLLDQMMVPDGGEIGLGRVLQPRVEAEMAFHLVGDIDSASPSLEEVRAAVGSVSASLEIVGSRIANWEITIVDTVADNGSAGAMVVSDQQVPLSDVDLEGASMTMSVNGVESSTGIGSACLGSPLNAAHWLAGELGRRGVALRSGHVILTGALGPMVSVSPGDFVEAQIDGLGAVRCRFAGEPTSENKP